MLVDYKDMSYDETVELTRSVMAILDSWKLNGQALLAILALPKGTPKRALRKYRESTPFPDDEQVYNRLKHIIGIADALRTSYPHNPAMSSIWLNQNNKRFNDRPPLQMMVQDGLKGLEEVRAHLDCAYDWQKNP